MSFSKRLIVISLIAVMVIGIVAIGYQNNKVEEENKEMAYYQTENVYLWYTNDIYTDYFTNAAVEFHEQNPDIRVIPTLVDSEEYLERINSASLFEDTFPDLFLITNDSLEKSYLSGLASKVKDTGKVLNTYHFSEGALNAVSYRGDYVGYPLAFETTLLLYNKTYLDNWVEKVNSGDVLDDDENSDAEKAADEEKIPVSIDDYIPETMDDILNFAVEYEAPEGVASLFKWDVSDIFYSYFFAGNYLIAGGDAGDDTDNFDIVNDNTIASLNKFQELTQYFSIDGKGSDYDSVLKDFLDGKTVYTIVTSDAIKTVQNTVDERKELIRINELADALEEGTSEESAGGFEEIPDYEYGYALIPDLTSELKSRSLSVTDTLVVNGYSQSKTAADKFAAFVSTVYSTNLYERTGRLAASTDAGYTDPVFLTFQEEYATSIPLPKMVETSNLWIQLEIMFSDILSGEDVKTCLRNFSDQINSQVVSN